MLFPGAAIMSALGTRPANTAGRVVLAVSLSLTAIMVVGGIVSLLGPHVGVAHPLDSFTQRIVWASLGVIILATSAINRRDPVTWIFEGVRSANLVGVLVAALLPLISILGVARLNHSGNARLSVLSAILDVVVLLVGIVGGWGRKSRWPLSTLLYAASLALLLSTSLRSGHLYGWDIQAEFGVASQTLHARLWVIPANHDPYASMLSLTVLPTILYTLVKLRLLSFFELVVPAILALLPLAVFSTVRFVPRWVNSKRKNPRPGLALAVVVGLVVSSAVFPSELVGITRQAMATTLLAALVLVMFDRTMASRPSRVVIGLLIIAISFTHYSTSYLLAGILLVGWLASLFWSQGWIAIRRSNIEDHRAAMSSRRILNGFLVALALVAALGWNLGVTRNNALNAPTGALATSGIGFTAKPPFAFASASALETALIKTLHKTDQWIVPVRGSGSIHLVNAHAPASPGLAPHLAAWWNRLGLFAHGGSWVLAGVAFLYGLFWLSRRKSTAYSAEIVGITVATFLIGGALLVSGTLATFFNPERGAIVAAILLAVPVTMFLSDLADRVSVPLLIVGVVVDALLVVGATGLGNLLFGGQAPGSLVAKGENVESFVVSTPELATAVWLRENLNRHDLVQSDRYGQLVLLSEFGTYGLLPEIVPPEVDKLAYVYLSTTNLVDHRSRFAIDNGKFVGVYRSNIGFFNKHFYVVYSTGVTRVYH
jgi:uncharacterized membrane protein